MRTTRSGKPRIAAASLAALFAASAAPAFAAGTCFTVFDRNNEVIYRDFAPPFDGAQDHTSAGREAMRARGEHLVFFEAAFCAPVSSVGGIGGRAYTTEEVVASFPGYAVRPDGSTIGARYGSLPTSATPVAPANNAVNVRMGSYR